MIEDWGLDDGKLEERKLCLSCIAKSKYQIDRKAYEFCHNLVQGNVIKDMLPTEDNLKNHEVKEYGGDYYQMIQDKILNQYEKYLK